MRELKYFFDNLVVRQDQVTQIHNMQNLISQNTEFRLFLLPVILADPAVVQHYQDVIASSKLQGSFTSTYLYLPRPLTLKSRFGSPFT
jgi:hypothetical protein